ncbi:MAG TPA: hypothetical protein VHJ37_11680 [Thermoleophilaceae bacterium]|nr:hypothetical protein [Thermoleophilaceae bacterium]
MGSDSGSAGSRLLISVVLIVLGAVLLFVGSIAYYARTEVIDQESFADRALVALEDDGLRKVVRREIVVNLIDRGSSDLIAARPLLESVVDVVLQSAPFRKVFRRAAVEANRVFFVRDKKNALFDISDSAELVRFALRSVSPNLAKEVPEDLDATLLTLRRREFAGQTLAVADSIRVLGVVLPLLALAAFAGGIAVAPDRRLGVLRSGVAVGATGALLAIALLVLRARILAGVIGEDELTDAEVRDAVAGLLDAFIDDLIAGAFLLALGGLVVGAAAAALDPEDVEQPTERLRKRLARRPRTTWGLALRGVAAVLLGVFVVLNPTLTLQVAAILAGAYLVFFGTSELLVLLQRGGVSAADHERSRRRAFAVAGVAGALCVAALIGLVLVVTRGGEPVGATEQVSSTRACNGSVSLCELPLNEVVFAGTHNSFSAADSPGWFIANQRHTIRRQLEDGVRLFLIDPHWGVEAGKGKVRTDFGAEGRDRNRVAAALPPPVLKAAERLAGRVGAGDLTGDRDVWLCHTTCELGATRMVDTLEVIRTFLDDNRGEVVMLFIEPYVPPGQIEKVFEESGLSRYVATLQRDEPLPTLGTLVRRNERAVVLTEKDADGSVPWYHDGFSFVQDTPLGATKVKQLSCKRYRGDESSPFLMLNHWADLFPPRLKANRPFQTEKTLIRRARRCARERGLPVSLIAVDYYDQGKLLESVDALNAGRVQAFRERQRTGSG